MKIEAIREHFAKYDLVTRRTRLKVRPVVACKGTTCNYGLCDTQAIATLAGVIKAKEEDIAYAMAAIFLFDILAAVSYLYLATALNLTVN